MPGVDELILLGVRAYVQGQLEESARLWREALEVDPGNERARRYLFQLQGETLREPPPFTPGSSPPACVDTPSLTRAETPSPAPTESPPPEALAPPPPEVPAPPAPEAPDSPSSEAREAQQLPRPPTPADATDPAATPDASPRQSPSTGRFKLPDHARAASARRAAPRWLRPVAIGIAVTCVAGLSAWGVVEISRREGPSIVASAWGGVQAAWSRLSTLPGWLPGRGKERRAGIAPENPGKPSDPSSGATSKPGDARKAGQPAGDRSGSRSPSASPSSSPGANGTRLASVTLGGFDGAPARLLPGARWGMTVEEALARLPSAASVPKPGPAQVPGLVRLARAGPVILEGQRYRADLLFGEDGGLKAILLASSVPGGARDAFEALARRLRTELGAPAEEDGAAPGDRPWRGRSRWTAPHGSIDVEGRDADDAEARLLAVDVRRGSVRPIPNGNVSIVLLDRDTPVHAREP